MYTNKTGVITAIALIIIAVIYLLVTSTGSMTSYFLTIEELLALDADALDRQLTISGVVIEDTIVYAASQPLLTFTLVHIPGDLDQIESLGGQSAAIEAASRDPGAASLAVSYAGIKPDLFQGGIQIIAHGQLAPDGVFYATELQLKCPSRYTE